MGIFQQFPYSNFHEFNLDQIIKIMREMQDEWETTKTEWASYKEYIDNYFANLDVSEEVLQAMRVLAEDGTLGEVIDPEISAAVALWLSEHITPTTPTIDTSLTVAGAAADAKAAGDRIALVESELINIPNTSLELINDTNFPIERVQVITGQYPNGNVGSAIGFSSNADYQTNKYKIPKGVTSLAAQNFTPNVFTTITDVNDIILAKGGTVLASIPAGSEYVYLSANVNTIPRITADNLIWIKSTDQFNYATEEDLYSFEHKEYYHNMIAPVSYEQLKSNPPSILTERDFTYQERHIKLNNNTYFSKHFFVNSSNLIAKLQLTCTVNNAQVRIMYKPTGNSWGNASEIINLINGVNDVVLTCDCASLIQYNDADDFALVFNGTSGTIVIDTVKIYEQNNLVTYPYYSDDFSTMMVNVFSELEKDDSIILTSPNGYKYKIIVNDQGELSTIPERSGNVPDNILIMGNSLVFGFHNANNTESFGMAATRASRDFANRFIAYTQNENPNVVVNKLYSSPFEHAETAAAATQFMTDNNSYWNNNVEMVIVQMGDNVNTEDKRSVFANSFPTLIAKIKNQCPAAVIIIVGIWFNNSTVFNIMKNTANNNNCIFVDIRGIRSPETEGTVGATVYFTDGTTTTVTEGRASHPGDLGMERIADAIEAVVDY